MPKWQWLYNKLIKKLWFRIVIFFILGIVTSSLSIYLRHYIPENLAHDVGSESVDNILNIIATSMLAVTTFSLSIMVAAYASASSNATPRATKLLLEDGTTQNALSVFIGSFVFSLVGIVSLRIGMYDSSGRLVLLVVTLAVVLLIILVFIKWIDYLSRLGRLSETIKMIEISTKKSFVERLKKPYMGCHKLPASYQSNNHFKIYHDTIGYIQNIDINKLSEIAKKHNVKIYILAVPGHFNDATQAIATLSQPVEDSVMNELKNTFSIHRDRSFEQDPRYGCVMLNEIATRALSSAMNDQGTAINIIDHMVKLLHTWITFEPKAHDITHTHLYVPEINIEQLMFDCFYTIIRDGSDKIEVSIRLQQAFKSIALMGDAHHASLARDFAKMAFERSRDSLSSEYDLTLLKNYIEE